jgi:hypothetical protein
MTAPDAHDESTKGPNHTFDRWIVLATLLGLFFVFAGDSPPGVNEAHYFVKAKNYWNPQWLAEDIFAASGNAHSTFFFLFGWPTNLTSLYATAWLGRIVGWMILGWGLIRFTRSITGRHWDAIAVACLWISGVYYGNLAGEWIIGGIEAKVPAYGLVLLGLSEVVERRWSRAWVWMGAASALHVLTGGWAVVASLIAWFLTEPRQSQRQPFWSLGLIIGGGLSLFGLIPALLMSRGADSGAAAAIYVYYRIPHHLLPAQFDFDWYLRHGVLVTLSLVVIVWLHRHRGSSLLGEPIERLSAMTSGSLVILLCGLSLGILPAVAPELAAKLLRFYWFRFSDAMVPLFLAVSIVLILRRESGVNPWLRNLAAAGLIAGVVGFVYASVDQSRDGIPVSVRNRLLGWDTQADRQQQARTFEDWIAVCRWAKQSTPPETMFLTPRHQQSFKWYAERPEVANWKDVPQDAASLIRWKQQFEDIYPARLGMIKVTIHYETLRRYRKQYGAQWMIVDNRVVGTDLPLIKAYPIDASNNATYTVYELPK